MDTVIVPVHQDPAVLRLFLDSLERTVEEPTQIIAVNDGSGPEVQDMLEERLSALKASHDGLACEVIAHAHPEGCARAINAALRCATGDYLYLVDSDVVLTPG